MTELARQQTGAILPAIDLAGAAFFLDFDGTLAPIEPRPDLVRLPDPVRDTLQRLRDAAGGALAVLSGRDLSDLDRMLAPLSLPAAGSHGLVRRDAGGRLDEAASASPALAAACRQLSDFADAHGLLLEPKRGGASLHYRSDPALAAACLALADAIEAMHGGLRVIRGHMVIEVTIRGRDKGHALTAFMAEAPFRGRMPVAVGDDTTDEDAFAAAQAFDGLTIRIGPGVTRATHRMPDIGTFHDWLHRLATKGGEGAP